MKSGGSEREFFSPSRLLFTLSKKTQPSFLPSLPRRAPLSTSTMTFAMTQAPARVVRGNSAAAKACAARYVGQNAGAKPLKAGEFD